MKESIESLSILFDKIYSAFILRDIAGKIIPGIIFTIGIYLIFFNFKLNLLNIVLKFNFGIWLLLIITFWIIGYLVQSFGEYFKIVVYALQINPNNKLFKNITLDELYDSQQKAFKYKNEENNLKYIERLASVREACGNSSAALIFIFLIFNIQNIHIIINIYFNYYKEIFIYLSVIFFLLRMHREHAHRYWTALNKLIESNEKRSQNGTN